MPIPDDLLAGLRALEDVPGFALTGPWTWQGEALVNHCTVTLAASSTFVDAVTHWTILTTARYPQGPLVITRAHDSGVRGDFPHELQKNTPCLITRAQPLGRWDEDPEPKDAFLRLEWHAVRLVQWVEKAAQGTLLKAGDPFGHPLIDCVNKGVSVNTYEDHGSLKVWSGHTGQSGQVQLRLDRRSHYAMYAVEFARNHQSIQRPAWGSWVKDLNDVQTGIWCLLPAPPFLLPWGFPATWGDLRRVFRQQDLNLDQVARQVILRGKAAAPFLLIGYPIPEVVGGPAVKIEWQACQLPAPGSLTARRKGFRNLPKSWWLQARQEYLGDGQKITWVISQNHQPSEFGSRGFLPDPVRRKRYVLIGGGALGSAIAEHLVRTGVTDIVIIDKDRLQARNLVRHTLTLHDVPHDKAHAVAHRLKAINTLVRPIGYATPFPPSEGAALTAVEEADVIIDTTGDDQVLAHLGQQQWGAEKDIINLSLGWRAATLYAYAERTMHFNAYAYSNRVGPHVARDLRSKAGEPPPMDGIGCWDPVWPALHTDIQLLSAAGAKFIHNFLEGTESTALKVFEQLEGATGFEGIRIRPEADV